MSASGARLLIVEDESDLREMLEFSLSEDSYRVSAVADGREAWRNLQDSPPDLVLLDWMLPDISGIELLRRIRREPRLQNVQVIMLTARAEETDRVRGLDSGADDYVIKPFSVRELRARIRTRLRGQGKENADDLAITVGGVTLDESSYRTLVGENVVDLGPTEFRLLRHFLKHPDRVYSRGQLIDAVWGTNVYIEERTVDVHIRRLRKALEPFGKASLIQTVRGAGYRLSERAD